MYKNRVINHLWIVWNRGDKFDDVDSVHGVYVSKHDAFVQAERAGLEGITPITHKLMANMWRKACAHLLERDLTDVNLGREQSSLSAAAQGDG